MSETTETAEVRFVAAVSHELRSPLHAVLGLSELLLEAGLDPRQQALAKAINHEAESMRILIDDILDLARLASGRFEVHRAPFSPVQEVSAIVEAHEPEARTKGLVLLFAADEGVPRHVLGDRLRFGQIARNLVSNAIRYTDQGSVRVHLALDANGELVLTVSDTGIGIPADRRDQLFEPFVRIHASRAGGTGLGLAVCARLASVLGGDLRVESTVGQGSAFSFACHFDESTGAIEEEEAVRRIGPARRGHVLVVEDSAVNQMLAANQLGMLGLESTVSESAERAFELLASRGYDAILMDWNLPGVDGLTATRRIRRDGLVAESVPIIAMTANALAGDREKCLAAGMTDFLAKPVGTDDLALVLDRWLDSGIEERSDAIAGSGEEALTALAVELGDPATVVVLVSTYLDELDDRWHAITHLDEVGAEAARRAAHTLKSTSTLLGAERLASLCREFESAALPPPELVERIDREISLVQGHFRDYIDRNTPADGRERAA